MDITVVPHVHKAAPPPLQTSDRWERFVGILILVGAFGGFAVWSLTAPLDSAVIAPGVFAVESSRKAVQHFEGGIVSQILVREGDVVELGQTLILLDDTQARAQLEIARSQYFAQRAEAARLMAERDEADAIVFPPDILDVRDDSRVAAAIEGQEAVFVARRKALEGESRVLEQRVDQLGEQIVGLEALVESKDRRIGLYGEEITGLKKLFDKGMGDKGRLREWERLVAELEGERAEHRAAIAAARVQIGETQLQVAQLRRRTSTEVVAQLREVETTLSDLRERMRALQNTLERTVIRAPIAGAVVGLAVHTEGGVIRAGDRLLELVPQDGPLLIEARVEPQDIDRVLAGMDADVQLTAFHGSTVPTVPGTVVTISADRLVDPASQSPYYLARIQLQPDGMDSLGKRTLQPGMPASVLIRTGGQTFFAYAIRPLTDRMTKALKED